jgi:outer membrane protein TolC
MKTTLKITLTTLLTVCVFTINAQTVLPADTLAIKKTADSILTKEIVAFPPLADLIDSAVKHNAMVKYRSQEIGAKEANLTSQRNYWMRNLGVQADTRYGTFDNFSSNASSGQSTTLLSVTSKQFNYGAGLFIKLPLYDLVNRKTQIKQAKAEVEQAKSQAQAQQDEIRQIVTRMFQDVLLRQKLLSIKSMNYGSATVNKEMVEKEFRNGIIPVSEYVRLSDMTARIQAEYEMAKSDFLVAKMILEEIVGFEFKNPELREK